MTQDDMHTIEAVRLADSRSSLARLLDSMVSQLEAIEADVSEQNAEIRRLRTIVGGLVEHEQVREEAEHHAMMLRRIDDGVRNRSVNPAFAGTLVSFSPLVPSEPRD